MSNHCGGYMLNDFLLLLRQYGFFDELDKGSMIKSLMNIINIGESYR